MYVCINQFLLLRVLVIMIMGMEFNDCKYNDIDCDCMVVVFSVSDMMHEIQYSNSNLAHI